MEGGGQIGGGGGGGGGGGPAPFLLKTYDMVDDSSTDDIVSWSDNRNSFVVWNPPEFAARLLPTYFKHNNFSSFIRQLNTYGFRKIDPEKWEFANEEFAKDQKHLLKNIHRRKPIHSHSHPPGSSGSSMAESERAALEDEIDQLTRDKAALQADLWRFKQKQSSTKMQLEDRERRVQDMEQRQLKMMSFLVRAVRNPAFVDHLIRMAETVPVDFSEVHKKRRLPGGGAVSDGSGQEVVDLSFNDNHSSTSKPELGCFFHQDFCNKLNLELSPAVSDGTLISPGTQSSNEDGGSPQRRQSEGGTHVRPDSLAVLPETLELTDASTPFCSRKNISSPWQARTSEEGDGHISCHLNLTLASSPLQLDNSLQSGRVLSSTSHGMDNAAELRSSLIGNEDASGRVAGKSQNIADDGNADLSLVPEASPSNNQANAPAAGRVNDKFWEHFLTERPGSSDIEEASSGFRTRPYDE